MMEALSSSSLTNEQASYLHFAIANAHDNLGEYELAMRHYDEAHRCSRRNLYGDTRFDEAEYEARFDAIRSTYDESAFGGAAAGLASDLPIFIVGMMRSGTTLTEQILSSHPVIGASGENEFWARRGAEAENLDKRRVDRPHAASLARQYCRDLRTIAPNCRRITDKLPGNYLRLGLIHLALPNAKIIHCRRSPVDTALSIYFTANPTAPPFSHTKEGIAFAFRQYQRLMDHWRKVLPADRMHEIRYEELVQSPRAVIGGMLEFLGLEWDEACLRHDHNAKDVRTPSLWQVRQPMYATSVQRWRRYEPWLGALRALLEPGDTIP
jgi:tetratricopeptide (TPR) repeat protein